MVLDYHGHPVNYARLLALLHIAPIGAPRRNILHLRALDMDVIYREATLSLLADYLQHQIPVIVFVDTAELPYWDQISNHAVVVIGMTPETITVNDPAFDTAPHTITRGDFELAWLNCDNACAILMPERAKL